MARCCASIILSIAVNVVVVAVLIAARGPLVRGFATHFIVPPSILPAPLRFPRLSTPPPVCCGAAHPLSRHQPLVGTTRVPVRFSLSPPASWLAPPLPSARRFLYLLREFTDQHDRPDHHERSAPRSSVKILLRSRALVVFPAAGLVRDPRYVSLDRCSANAEATLLIYIPTSLIATLLSQ